MDIFFCLVFAVLLCASVYMCLVVTAGKGLTSWISFVVSNCECVTFPLVSWGGYGTFPDVCTLTYLRCYLPG